jgi:hypothetical protein
MFVVEAMPIVTLAHRANRHAAIAFALPTPAFATGLPGIGGGAIGSWRLGHDGSD